MIIYPRNKTFITNSTERSPSREVSSCSASQEIPHLLWNSPHFEALCIIS